MLRKFFALFFTLSLLAGCGTAAAPSNPESTASSLKSAPAPEAPAEISDPSPEEVSAPEAPAESASPMEKLLNSYYLSADERGADFSLEDASASLAIWGVNGQINETRLIPTFRTDTDDRDELLELCQRIKNGGHLHDFLQSENQLYTILTDSEGKDIAYAVIDAGDLSAQESGGLVSRRDFRSHDDVEELMAQGKLDPDGAKMVYCVISNFSVGTLLYDGEREYFIPSVESIESMDLVRVGEIYPLSDIIGMIESNIDNIFPINEVDESGNPYTM